MLIAFGTSLAALMLTVLIRRRAPWNAEPAQLGSVSERWLAEHRAAHPS
jgi:hypothetical protein